MGGNSKLAWMRPGSGGGGGKLPPKRDRLQWPHASAGASNRRSGAVDQTGALDRLAAHYGIEPGFRDNWGAPAGRPGGDQARAARRDGRAGGERCRARGEPARGRDGGLARGVAAGRGDPPRRAARPTVATLPAAPRPPRLDGAVGGRRGAQRRGAAGRSAGDRARDGRRHRLSAPAAAAAGPSARRLSPPGAGGRRGRCRA